MDPIIHDARDSQSLNPYSYLANRPLSGTDPTGYEQCTGSHVEQESCESPTLSVSQVGSPSVSEAKAAQAAHQSNGATPGQSNNSVKPVEAANVGNPTTDPSSKPEGNPASGNYNGGSDAQSLGTIKVTAPSYGRVLWNSIQAHLSLLNPWNDDFFYDGFSPVNPREPTRRERLEAQLAQQAAQHPTAVAAGSAIVTLGTIVVFPEGGAETEAGALGGDASTLGLGPYAGESIPARSAARDFSPAERAEINRIGQATGCHTCGATNPGTKSGNHIPDHQPVSKLNSQNGPQRLYPHCIDCSRRQGGEVLQELLRRDP